MPASARLSTSLREMRRTKRDNLKSSMSLLITSAAADYLWPVKFYGASPAWMNLQFQKVRQLTKDFPKNSGLHALPKNLDGGGIMVAINLAAH